MNRCIKSGGTASLLFAMLIVTAFAPAAWGQATSITSMGFRTSEGGGGALTTEWTTGNLGNTWAEGEWVPYQLVINNVQTDYPGLAGFPTITMSYDFTGGGSSRFVDLVRSIQAGTAVLGDTAGWPRDDHSAYPLANRTQIENAQNDVGNTAPRENTWTGFTLVNLPDSQMNRAADLGTGTPTDAEHIFYITLQDLLDAGIPTNANTIVIYYQLHEARTFVWQNSLQEFYCEANTPGAETDDWGGYLYCLAAYAADTRLGSGYVPGSSGHIEVEFASGAKTVPIPIPSQLPGAVSGLKWLDENGDGIMDGGEPSLSNWPIYVSGTLEGINFADTALTDGSGNYSFPNLTSGTTWTVKEAETRAGESGYVQTYPPIGTVLGVGTGVSVAPPPPGVADWGWDVSLTLATPTQADMNFGNMLCQITITCPPDATVDCNGSTEPSSTGYPTVDANCPPVDTTYSDVVTNGDCDIDGYLYRIARTWVVTDEAGNADTCVQTVTVTDTTAPVITCPTDATYECDASWSFGTPSATDDCDNSIDISVLSTDTIPGTCPENFQVVRTWVATDDCGNADTCSQTITIQDTTPPVISCPTDLRFECDNIGAFGTATATDNCDADPTVVLNDVDTIPGSCPSNFQIVREFIATDNCGNADTCSQTITIEDTTPPVLTCPGDKNFECDAVGSFGTATATDNCDTEPTITFSDDTVSTTCPLQINRMYVAVDDCGNADTCYQSITIDDTTPPVVTCPTDRTFECDNIGDFGTATATDNCDASPTVVLNDVDTIPGSCPSNFQIVREFIATDDCGNADTCSQTITIQDTTDPVVICPADINANCDAIPGFGTATATDNCDADPRITSSDDTLSTTCPLQISRMWVATDACGNADTCYQSIIVDDTTAPVLSCPADVNASCDAIPGFGSATATDNCDTDPTITSSDDTLSTTCPLQISRMWVATDDCGNADTCYQSIIVDDTTPPVISCPADQTFECDAIGAFGTATATDNCDASPTVVLNDVDTIPGSCPSNFQIVRQFIATDDCGNADTCAQTITIQDTTDPVLSGCPTDTTVSCDESIPAPANVTATDNCGDVTPVYSQDSTGSDCRYVLTRMWVATDACGNADTCTQDITVVDTTAPTISITPLDTIACEDPLVFDDPVYSDNCDPAPTANMVLQDTTLGPNIGEVTYRQLWVATDRCGLDSDTAIATVIRLDCPNEFCTYTMGGWGSGCPGPQIGDAYSIQPGCIRDYYFAMAFPTGIVLGDPAGPGGLPANRFSIKFTSALAVENFLPAGGTPKVLKHDYTDPWSTEAGVLAGQILALTMNRGYSCAGVFHDIGLTEDLTCFGTYEITTDCGSKFDGLTVDQFLVIANQALSGDVGVLIPYHAKVSDVAYTAGCLNEMFNFCDPNLYPLADYWLARLDPEEDAAEVLPLTYSLSQNHPNPFNPTTTINFTLPATEHVTIEVFNVLGQRVSLLLDDVRGAGMHSVAWNAGKYSSGIYFYRLRAGEFVETKKMLLMK